MVRALLPHLRLLTAALASLSISCVAGDAPASEAAGVETVADETVHAASWTPLSRPGRGAVTPVSPALAAASSADPRRSFADAVATADFVGEVRVVRVAGRDGVLGRAQVEAIWSDVDFEVRRAVVDRIERPDVSMLRLAFLGGSIGGRSMWASTSPILREGDHLVIIARGGASASPTYRGEGGVLRIEGGRVFTYDQRPVIAVTADGPVAARGAPAIEVLPLGRARVEPIGPSAHVQAPLRTEAFLEALQQLSRGAP